MLFDEMNIKSKIWYEHYWGGRGFANGNDIILLLGIEYDNIPILFGMYYADNLEQWPDKEGPKDFRKCEKIIKFVCGYSNEKLKIEEIYTDIDHTIYNVGLLIDGELIIFGKYEIKNQFKKYGVYGIEDVKLCEKIVHHIYNKLKNKS